MTTLALAAAQSDAASPATTLETAMTVPVGVQHVVTNPAVEIALATLFLVIVIGIHGVFLGRISKLFSTHIARQTPQSPRWHAGLLTAISIGLIVALHFGETHLWALTLNQAGLISGYRDAYFYVLEAYTTLGEGSVYMPDGYRLISPIIALTGLFTFGWSTSVFVYIVGQVGRLHEEREKQSPPSA
jgi:hypothetical protein